MACVICGNLFATKICDECKEVEPEPVVSYSNRELISQSQAIARSHAKFKEKHGIPYHQVYLAKFKEKHGVSYHQARYAKLKEKHRREV